MGSIKRQDSFSSYYDDEEDDDDLYIRDDDRVYLEAPTLSSEQMERAREEALYIMKTKTAEEAFKIFTAGSHYKVEGPPLGAWQQQDKTAAPPATTTTPPTATANGKEQPQATAPPSKK